MNRKSSAALSEEAPVSHNLLGQRLGRKGLVTRQRILTAARHLLDNRDTPISLSAVAREASLSMTAIYLYFADLTELLLALLVPVAEEAEESHIADMREHWSDDQLTGRCHRFIQAYHRYWEAHAGLLLLRNQLGGAQDRLPFNHRAMAAVLITGVDRVMTIHSAGVTPTAEMPKDYLEDVLFAQARLLELAIREGRLHSETATLG